MGKCIAFALITLAGSLLAGCATAPEAPAVKRCGKYRPVDNPWAEREVYCFYSDLPGSFRQVVDGGPDIRLLLIDELTEREVMCQ